MKRSAFLIFVVALVIITPLSAYQDADIENTILILVRHAEKDGGGRDPELSEIGVERALNLSKKLSDYSIKEIYSTPFKRTMNTAKPTADSFGLEIHEYMPQKNMSDFLKQIIEKNTGNTVLIVGHSNTTPQLVNLLIGDEELEPLNEDQYGDIFIVNLSTFGEGELKVDSF